MGENGFLDLSSHTSSSESSFGWVPMEHQESTNTSDKPETKLCQDITDNSDTSSDDGSSSEKSDLKSSKEAIIVKKERVTHQLSEEDSKSPPSNKEKVKKQSPSNKEKVKKQCKLEDRQADNTEHKICFDGTLDTSEGIPFNLDSDDEVWIVQCPANVENSDLKGKMMDFGGTSTFGANFIGTTLSQQTDEEPNINLLMPNKHFELKAVHVAGHIIISEKVDVPHLELPAVRNKIATPLPEGLKLRHPLLGSVNSNSGSFDCDAAYSKHNRKRKKHKHVDSSQNTTYSDMERSPSPNRKRKKHKHVDSSQNTTYSDLERSPSPNRKRKKHKHVDSSQTTTYSDSERSALPNKKKKKKKKEMSQSESIEITQNIIKKEEDNEIEDVIESSQATKKKKFSLHEDHGSEILFPLSQYFDDSTETNNSSYYEKNKNKKKKKTDKYDITESQVRNEALVTPTHFKKKKRKSDTDDSISLLDTSRSKKNAKKYDGERELISPRSHNFSPVTGMMKRRHSGNEANSVSPKKKKKLKLSYSQDGE